MPEDYTALTDEQLADERQAIANETERRQRLAAIPVEVARLAAQYEADGGDAADLMPASPAE